MEAQLQALVAQHGVFLRREALAVGYHDRAIASLVRTGAWVRVRRGAYVFGDGWAALTANQRYAVLCRAAVRQANTHVILSHTSSANEYGAPLWDCDLSTVHLTRPDERAGRVEAGIAQHRGVIADGDVEIARVDLAWPELGVFLEFDGRSKYVEHLREGESVVDCVLREKQRESRICEITGWRCIRIVWADLYRPAEVAARIRALFRAPAA